MDKKIIGIMFGKDESVRCKNKNHRFLCGKPLIEWTMIQLWAAKIPYRKFISTNSEKFARMAEKYDIEWIPETIKPGEAGCGRAHWLAEEYLMQKGIEYDATLSLLPTSPIRKPDDIDRMCKTFIELKKIYWDMRDMTMVIPRKEVFLLAQQQRKYQYRAAVFDKSYYYAENCGGISMIDKYLTHENNSDPEDGTDKRLDILSSLNVAFNRGVVPTYACPAEVWQWPEIDEEVDFEIAEVIFKHYILDKLGEDCYIKYRGENETRAA